MKKSVCFLLCFVLVFLCACSNDIAVFNNNLMRSSTEKVIDETITLMVLGDNLLHMPVINSGKKDDGTYDFSHIFKNLQPLIKDVDIAVIGQETVFGGEDLGYSGYPLFNSPSDMGKTLVNEGFDVVLHASNHILDKGSKGVERTIDFWKDYPQVTVLGINESIEQKETVKIIEQKGAKIAVLNYTYGTNGIPLPKDKPYLVNLIDKEKIKRDAYFSETNADFTVAFIHWGTEYSTKPDAFQKELALSMCGWGVDLIVGSHPHVIEPVEWIQSENGNKMLVYYSLGNFVSRQLGTINLLGGIAQISLKFDGESVSIKDNKFIPIVTHYNRNYADFGVYRLGEYNDTLSAVHGVSMHDGKVSVERFKNMVTSIFEGYNADIEY